VYEFDQIDAIEEEKGKGPEDPA
jgi:hypothetical protein